jgi:hypothetical protein
MPFKKGNPGKPKGAKNKHSFNAEEIANKFDLEPLEVLMMICAGDWNGLGFNEKTKTSFTNAGIEFEEDHVKLEQRISAAKEASKYLYSAKQAVEVSGNVGIKVIIEDFTKKE